MLDDVQHTLTYSLEAEPAPVLAEGLYGPAWRDSLTQRDHGRWKARRLPPPLYAAPFLAPLLRGSVAHDGRSTRDGRGAGWWVRDEVSDSWRESDVDAVGSALLPPLNGALRERQEIAESLDFSFRRIDRKRAAGRYTRASSEVSAALLVVEVLSALSALVASGSSGRWGGVAAGLRSLLPLSETALASLVLEWLEEVTLVEGWAPGSRVSPVALWEAYEADGGALPRRTFPRAVSLALGGPPPIKSNGQRFYVLPDLDDLQEVAS